MDLTIREGETRTPAAISAAGLINLFALFVLIILVNPVGLDLPLYCSIERYDMINISIYPRDFSKIHELFCAKREIEADFDPLNGVDLQRSGQTRAMKIDLLKFLAPTLLLATSGFAGGQGVQAKVVVHPDETTGVMAPEALGVAAAVWDKYLTDPAVSRLIKDAGFKVIRYPGGSLSDIYHWKDHSLTKGTHSDIYPNTQFDSFMSVVRKSRAQALITANYGSNSDGTGGGDPAEAAAWVKYANLTKRYGIKYWEIGNEIPGNGFYNGKGWEEDLHAPDTGKKEDRQFNPALGPVTYGNNVNAFVRAMKAEDPSIKVGIVMNDPGSWPDGIQPDWNPTVLQTCGQNIDFVIVHWYGYGMNAKEVLNSIGDVPRIVSRLRKQVDQYCGERSKQIQIWMTEGDASGFNTRHPGSLFAADHLLTWWESGATHVNWWNIHNGAVGSIDNAYDDQGILSNGSSFRDHQEPPVNTPFPPYFGVKMVSQMVRPGDSFVASASDNADLRVHASRGRKGDLSVMLINRDPDHAADATLNLSGFEAGGRVIQYTYGPDYTEIKKTILKTSGQDAHYQIPAYSIVVLQFAAAKRAQ